MAITYSLIASNTLGSSAASVTFSSIPNTYTDLVLRASVRDTDTGTWAQILGRLNSDSGSNYSETLLRANGSVAASNVTANQTYIGAAGYIVTNGSGTTSNTFSNTEIYIPSYTASQNKPISAFSVQESNSATGPIIAINAELWRNTSAITSITLFPVLNFVSGSSFFLYGIKKD